MTGYTVHTGSTLKFAAGWDEIFGKNPRQGAGGKTAAARSRSGAKSASRKAAGKKKAPPKGAAKKRTGATAGSRKKK